MADFIFILTLEDSASAIERMATALDAMFPEHNFTAGTAEPPDMENMILIIQGTAGSGDKPGQVVIPDVDEVERVALAFERMLEETRGWRPS